MLGLGWMYHVRMASPVLSGVQGLPFRLQLGWIDCVSMTGSLLKNGAYEHRNVIFHRLHS